MYVVVLAVVVLAPVMIRDPGTRGRSAPTPARAPRAPAIAVPGATISRPPARSQGALRGPAAAMHK
jgi:hypothetical protein